MEFMTNHHRHCNLDGTGVLNIPLCALLSFQVSYYPTLRETGAVFVCRWQQLAKVGCHLGHHILHQDKRRI